MVVFFGCWMVLLFVMVVGVTKRLNRGGPLTLAYFCGLSLIHVPGVLPFLWEPSEARGLLDTETGFKFTIIGMTAFVISAMVAGKRYPLPLDIYCRSLRSRSELYRRVAGHAVVVGIIGYFVLLPLSRYVPSLTAIVSASATVLIVGIWFVLYWANDSKNRHVTLLVFLVLPLLPL